MGILRGTDEGHTIYKKYLAMSLDFNKNISAIRNGSIKEGRCSREAYSANKGLYFFEQLVKTMETTREAEMLFYSNFVEGEKYYRSFDKKKYEEFSRFLEDSSYIIVQDLKSLLQHTPVSEWFDGEPSTIVKAAYAGDIRMETFLYLTYAVAIPIGKDMIGESVKASLRQCENYFLYFSNRSKGSHQNEAIIMIQNLFS